MSDKVYPLTITPLWQQGYLFASLTVNEDILEALSRVEIGGKLTFKPLKTEFIRNERSPQAYIEYLTPAQVEDARNKYLASKTTGAADADI